MTQAISSCTATSDTTKTANEKCFVNRVRRDISRVKAHRLTGRIATMTKLRRFGSLRYRMLALTAMLIFLTALLVPAASPQTSCCQKCLDRFNQCDGTTIVCCRIYDGCVQQCAGGCPRCP